MRVIAALASALMGGKEIAKAAASFATDSANMAKSLDRAGGARPNGSRRVRRKIHSKALKALISRKENGARRRNPGQNEPIPLSYDGQTFPSRGALARHLAPIVKRSVSTMIQMLRTNDDDAAAVVRHYQPNSARSLSAAAPKDPDQLALAYLSNELTKGPIEAAAIDAMVEKGRFHAASVEKAKDALGVVAIRANFGRGSALAFRAVAPASRAAEIFGLPSF
jgi:hypothetical protein